MGKVKKTRHNRFNIYNNTNIVSTTINNSNQSQYNYINELTNIDSKKRLKSCRILSNIFLLNSNNIQTLNLICKPDLLTKLSLRLLDTNVTIRLIATEAIRNLTTCDDDTIIQKIIDAGIFRTLTTLLIEGFDNNIIDNDHYELVIHGISNLISSSEICLTNLLSINNVINRILDTILSINNNDLININKRMKVIEALVNLLHIASDSNNYVCSYITDNGYLDQIIQLVYRLNTFSQTLDKSNEINEIKYLYIKCIGIIINCYTTLLHDHTNTNFYINEIALILKSCMIIDTQDVTALVSYYSSIEPTIIDDSKSNADVMDSSAVDEDAEDPRTDEDSHISGTKSLILTISSVDIVKLISELIANLTSLVNESISSIEDDDNEMELDDDADDNEIEIIANNQSVNMIENIPIYIQSLVAALKQVNIMESISTCVSITMSTINNLIVDRNNVALTSSFSTFIDLLDTLVISSSNVLSNHILSDAEMSHYITIYINVYELSYNVMSNTIRSVDRLGQAIPTWPVHNSVNYKYMLDCIYSLCMSISEYMSTIFKIVDDIPSNVIQNLSILYMKFITQPILEIVIITLEVISQIVSNKKIIISSNIYSLLTNCILRRLNDPASYSIHGKNNSLCPIYLIDSCIMTMIDLHSDDALEIYEFYKHFDVNNKLSSSIQILSIKTKESIKLLPKEDFNKFKDTIANGKRFLKYKLSFEKTLK